MFQYTCLNPIADVGLNLFSADYAKVDDVKDADAALVRSASLHDMDLGDKVLAVKYDEVEVKDTHIETKLKEETAYYNLKGNRIDKSTIKKEDKKQENDEDINELIGTLIPKEKDKKWGFVDKHSNVIVEYKYDKVTEFNIYGFAGVKLNGKWGCIDENGNIVVEPIYNLDKSYEVEFIGKYYKVVEDYKTVYYSDYINQGEENE